jgi:nitrogen regulatory protein P-II 1
MKQIVSVIKPARLEAVQQALQELEQFPGFTFWSGRGNGRGTGNHHAYAAADWSPDHDCNILMIYCSDAQAGQITDAIKRAAYTGNPADGIIAVSDVDNIVRIRTGELGDYAV